MKRKILGIILCLCIIATSCTKTEDVLPDINTEIITTPIEDKFKLTALSSDKQGIEVSTGFQLTSNIEIKDNFIKDNLQIIPSQEYKIEKISATVHNIIPVTSLENDKVYQIKINDEDYDYSWAFQTKKKFEVESTIPSNDSIYVPVNSGIEMYFTLSSLDEIEDYFEIKPHVEGNFIYKDNAAIFVPNKLEENVQYTVTIKKGYGLKDGEQKLNEDYSFTFNTKLDTYSKIYFDSPLTNIYEKNTKIIEAYLNDKAQNTEYNINIYQYNSSKAFAKNMKYYADTGKFVNDENNIEAEGLVKINTIKQKPFMSDESYRQRALFELPSELSKGYYLLELIKDGSGEKAYQFLQINDMLIYYAFFDNEIVVFVANGEDSKGIVDAAVIVNDEHLGFTDNDGMLVTKKDTSIYEDVSISLRVEAKGFSDFIYADGHHFVDYFYRSQDEAYEHIRYMDTDRPVYLPTDKVYVWGFARPKNDKAINKVRIELVEAYTDLVLEEKTVDLTNIGTYQTEFEFKNITSENLAIHVYDNDIKISSRYISIGEYTKPLFTMEGEFNKKYVYSGEDIEYKINANFFDGYPVPNLEVSFNTRDQNYSDNYASMDSSVKLNEHGEAIVDVNTEIISDNWRPITINMNCWNKAAEDKAVNIYDSFEIFPKRYMVEVKQNDINNPDSVDILVHELDNSKYNSPEYKGYEDLRGKSISGSIAVDIDEIYYEKVKTGEHYDYINKVNVIEYSYNRIQNRVYSEQLNAVDGYANIKIPNFNPERIYEVTAYYAPVDESWHIREVSTVGVMPYYYERLSYSLERADENNSLRLNDNVNLQLVYNHINVENIENDNMVLLLMRDGLIDYKTTNNTSMSFTFKEDYIPNVIGNSVYIKNGYMYPVEVRSFLDYDETERQIYFDVTTDKEEYRPGEEVVLNINAKDENNNPIVADVNISVVDEAYFALFNKKVDTLGALYHGSWNTGLNALYMSNVDLSMDKGGGAEMGGGGGYETGFRDDFKDTNIFKTVTTDKNGNASLKFKLADNLTSWRITYQGISDELYAGSGTKNITVSLPFYVDLIMGKEYLKEDKVSASLRVFGNEAKTSQQATYEVTVKNIGTGKELKYNQDGVIGSYTNIQFDKLDVGQYEISVYAKYKDFEDGIKENFNVVDSSIYFNNTDYYKLSDNTVLEEVYSNPEITLFNESTSDFYNSLNDISTNSGKRIDQTVCSLVATKYINEYFKTDLPFDEDSLLQEINKYEAFGGGLSLLTYSEADVDLTAKLMNIVDEEYLNTKAKKYFKRVLVDNTEYNNDIAAALWGLSKYKEPVLLTIYNLIENDSLEPRDKIYLALALTELGDKKTARKVYEELKDNIKEEGSYLYFESGEDENYNYTEDYELTALLAIVGVKLNDFDTSDKLFKYIYHNPSKYTLCNLEQLIYIMNRDIMNLEEIKDLFGEVTVTADGTNKKTYKLKLFDRESFAVAKEKIKTVKFSDIKGSITCKVEALGNKDDLEKNKTNDFSIKTTYTLKDTGNVQMSFNHSDVVKVTIMPSFSPEVKRGNYEITYIVPAGFRYMEKDNTWPFWVEENGQKLKFNFYYDRQNFAAIPITFYIQAAQKGEYTVDYVVIKENLETKLNYLNKEVLTVN